MSMIFTGGKTFRSVKTAGHSRFWQSRRSFHHSIRQCQLLHSRWQLCCLTDVACPLRVLGFASGQSECPAGHVKYSLHTRPIPEGHRTRAASVPQPFPTVVFAVVSPDGEIHSLCGVDTKQAIS